MCESLVPNRTLNLERKESILFTASSKYGFHCAGLNKTRNKFTHTHTHIYIYILSFTVLNLTNLEDEHAKYGQIFVYPLCTYNMPTTKLIFMKLTTVVGIWVPIYTAS
jgi:hypothetical protein